MQLVDFVKNLHDRQALEKREAKRLFLGGEGFVAWPGPGVPQVRRRADRRQPHASGGFVIDGHTVTLADIDVPDPVLRRQPRRDGPPRRGARHPPRRAARSTAMYEVPLKAGHFGLVVGSTALTVTWPSVVEWMRWREGDGAAPQHAIDVRARRRPRSVRAPPTRRGRRRRRRRRRRTRRPRSRARAGARREDREGRARARRRAGRGPRQLPRQRALAAAAPARACATCRTTR